MAFMKPWSGELMAGPQAVLPRSLMRLVARLDGRAGAACAITWPRKNTIETAQSMAPKITLRAMTAGKATEAGDGTPCCTSAD